MYAALRRYKFDEKNAQELDKKIRDIFVPLIEKTPGFISYYWMDTGRGEGASTRIAANFVKNNLKNIKLSPPEITEGKIQAYGERASAPMQTKDKTATTRPSAH